MRISKTFTEGWYLYWCDVEQNGDGGFSCDITFTNAAGELPLVTKKLKISGAFASAELAMGAGENYGRWMICEHGDVPHYLSNNTPPEM